MMQISEAFFDKTIQVESLIHIGTMCAADDRWPDLAREAFDDDADEIWEALGVEPLADSDDIPELSQAFVDRDLLHVFLMKVSTPVPKDIREGAYSFSWGCYTTAWVAGSTYKECCMKAIEWRDAYIDEKRGVKEK